MPGIMPGPKEPKKNVNTYLQPLVNELKELWTGVPMKIATCDCQSRFDMHFL